MKSNPLSETHRLSFGVGVIRAYVQSLPSSPGVYRMISEKEDVLYVGKAKNLKKRVASYTNLGRLSIRIQRMVNMTRSMEFISTHTEAEALLLEADLIKKLMPRYNILLRDDKSFPSILITNDHKYPCVIKHRGPRNKNGKYFGPFASAGAVNQSLLAIQKAFLLRTCSDNVFAGRKRPCLLFQIKRCAAPCVGKIAENKYAQLVSQAHDFLTGKSQEIQKELALSMQKFSDNQDYEEAAVARDRIRAMTSIQSRQHIYFSKITEADIIALHRDGGQTCIQVFFHRAGYSYGNHAFYPAHASDIETSDILEAFIGQFYANKRPPRLIILSEPISNKDLLLKALSARAERQVKIEIPFKGEKKHVIDMAVENAQDALRRRVAHRTSQGKLLDALMRLLDLDNPIGRIEIFDNSHISGTNSVGAMVVSGPEGFIKGSYRKFNIGSHVTGTSASVTRGDDDYAMMKEVLTRRFSRAINEDPDHLSGQWPDLVLIDGGAGHLSIALKVFEDLGITEIPIVAIAKGPNRNAGREKIFAVNKKPFNLDSRDPLLYFLQRLRDEAHRFAIGSHRIRRKKAIKRSPLDEIPGIGGGRKKALLHRFGSSRSVSEAGVGDLESVDGISRAMAIRIYDWFHSEV